MGFAINTAFRPSTPTPTPTVRNVISRNLWELMGTAINHSSVVPSTATHCTGSSMTSFLKDTMLSVYNPGSTSLSVVTQVQPASLTLPGFAPPIASGSSSRGPSTRAEKLEASTDMILRPLATTPSANVLTSPFPPSVSQVAKVKRAEGTTAVSLRVIDSLSNVAGATAKTMVNLVRSDMSELFEAVDELMGVICDQTQHIVQQSKGKARAIGEQVQSISEQVHSRNDRARGRAKALRKKGEEFFVSAGEQIIGRTGMAKKQARKLKQKLKAEAWHAYEKAHGTTVNLNARGRNRRCKRGSGHHAKEGWRNSLYSCI